MIATEFKDLIRKMRLSQKNYFRTRSKDALQSAKVLEAKVDSYLFGNPQLSWDEEEGYGLE